MKQRILIVGGGLAGCSIAWHLSEDVDVCIVESGSALGGESSTQNAGMLRRLGEDPYERKLAQRSHLFLEKLHEDWNGLEPVRKTGALMLLAQDPHHLEDGVSHLRAIGAAVEELRELSSFRGLLGQQSFCKAYFLPNEFSCAPEALMKGFQRGIQRKKHTTLLNTRAVRLLVEGDRVIGVDTGDKHLLADKVVLAAGAWSSGLALTIGLHRPITPLRRSIFFTGAHPAHRANLPWFWIDDIGIYARPYQGGFLVSPCDERVDWPTKESSWGHPEAWQEQLLQEKLSRYFPGITLSSCEKTWTGLRNFAADRRPMLGEDPDCQGLWWATGLGGFGLSCSIGVGEALSSWLEQRPCAWLDPRPVNPGRPLSRKWLMRPDGHIHNGELIDSHPPSFR